MTGDELSPDNLAPATRTRRFPERSRGPRLSPRSLSRPRRRTSARTSAAWPYPRPPNRRRRRPPAAPARPVPLRSSLQSGSAPPDGEERFCRSSFLASLSSLLCFLPVVSLLPPFSRPSSLFFPYFLPLFPLSFLSPFSFSFLSPSLFFLSPHSFLSLFPLLSHPFSLITLYSFSHFPLFSSFPTPLIPQNRGTRAHRYREAMHGEPENQKLHIEISLLDWELTPSYGPFGTTTKPIPQCSGSCLWGQLEGHVWCPPCPLPAPVAQFSPLLPPLVLLQAM